MDLRKYANIGIGFDMGGDPNNPAPYQPTPDQNLIQEAIDAASWSPIYRDAAGNAYREKVYTYANPTAWSTGESNNPYEIGGLGQPNSPEGTSTRKIYEFLDAQGNPINRGALAVPVGYDAPSQGGLIDFVQENGWVVPLALATAGAATGLSAGAGAATAAGTGAAGSTAASTLPAWVTAAGKGALTGAALGGGSAAIQGGDIGKGLLTGALTGAVGGGVGSALGGGLVGNVAGGALAGGAGSAIRGGNVLEGALIGGAGGAINTGINELLTPVIDTTQALPYTESYDAWNLAQQGLGAEDIARNLSVTGLDDFLATDLSRLASQGLSSDQINTIMGASYSPQELANTGIESLDWAKSATNSTPGISDLIKGAQLVKGLLGAGKNPLQAQAVGAQPTAQATGRQYAGVDYSPILNLLALKSPKRNRNSLLG